MPYSFFRIHGGKYYLARWVLDNAPKNYQDYNYVEGFGGAANVLLRKKPSGVEWYFESNYEIYKMFHYLLNDFDLFYKTVQGFGANKDDFLRAKEGMHLDSVYGAVCSYVVAQLRFGTVGRTFAKTSRIRGGRNELENRFENNKLKLVHIRNRFSRVILCNDDFLPHLSNFKSDYFLYLDPPYVKSTRTTHREYGNYEFSDEKHELLCDIINDSSAKILLSGYDNGIYRRKLKNWEMVKKVVPLHSSSSNTKPRKVECLWKNY